MKKNQNYVRADEENANVSDDGDDDDGKINEREIGDKCSHGKSVSVLRHSTDERVFYWLD